MAAKHTQPARMRLLLAATLVFALIGAETATAATRSLAPAQRHGRTLGTAAPPDSPPSTPTKLGASAAQTSVSLSWAASTDDVGVAGYGLYVNGTLTGTTKLTSFTFSGLACGTSYTLSVDAYDAAGNRSAKAALGAATLACSSSSTQPTYQIPATIASDCSVDVTQPILSWIASVPDNSTLSFGSGACYRIDGTLELRRRNGLDFEGNGATFKATTTGDGSRSQWRVVDSSNFVFRNMTIRGANPNGGTFAYDLQHQHAFDLLGASGIEIDHANASDLYGDCVYIGRGNGRTKSWSRNIRVRNTACARNGRMGIAITAGRHVLVEMSSFAQIALSTFDIEPNGAGFGARDITFTRNTVGSVHDYVFVAPGDGPVGKVAVSHNRLVGVGMHIAVLTPLGQRRSRITISRNHSDTGYYESNGAAMKFRRIDGLAVTRNSAPLSGPNMALASVSRSCNVNISRNRFPGGVAQARISRYSSGRCHGARGKR